MDFRLPLTSLHVGQRAVVGVLKGLAVVVEDHVVVHRCEDGGYQGLADLAAIAVAMLVQELVERHDLLRLHELMSSTERGGRAWMGVGGGRSGRGVSDIGT